MDLCLLIARSGRHPRQRLLETGTIIATDFIIEDIEYLYHLIQTRQQQKNGTGYPSDWSEAKCLEPDTEPKKGERRKQVEDLEIVYR